MITEHQKQEIRNEVERYMLRADALWNRSFIRPSIAFCDLGASTAGMASCSGVRFNVHYIAKYQQEFVQRTVPHEVAHYIDAQLHNGFRRQPSGRVIAHDDVWRSIFRRIAPCADLTRCHSWQKPETSRTRIVSRFEARCNCRTHNITSVKRNRILQGRRGYICVRCRAPLVVA